MLDGVRVLDGVRDGGRCAVGVMLGVTEIVHDSVPPSGAKYLQVSESAVTVPPQLVCPGVKQVHGSGQPSGFSSQMIEP